MAAFLIDYENVNGGGLKGVELLNDTDSVILFYSMACHTIRRDELEAIMNSGCDFRIVELQRPSPNGLDFYIAVEAGSLANSGETQIEIISNDGGFQAVVDYLKTNHRSEGLHVYRASTIEKAISCIDSPNNKERRSEACHRMQKLDLGIEYAKYEERSAIREQIKRALNATEYENRIPDIVSFVLASRLLPKKEIYTGTLHTFGKIDGLEIYRRIKDAV